MYFTKVAKTDHYRLYHEHSFPWSAVLELIYSCKEWRRIDNRLKIESDKYYILCEVKENTLYIINAKWK